MLIAIAIAMIQPCNNCEPVVSVDSITDSATRQTLPAFLIDCTLNDANGRTARIVLNQVGGRGVRARAQELAGLPIWRTHINTPVRLTVVTNQGGLLLSDRINTNVSAEMFRWDVLVRRESQIILRDNEPDSYLSLAFAGVAEARGAHLIAPVIVGRQAYSGFQIARHSGFCRITPTAQNPLSPSEEAEFRRQ